MVSNTCGGFSDFTGPSSMCSSRNYRFLTTFAIVHLITQGITPDFWPRTYIDLKLVLKSKPYFIYDVEEATMNFSRIAYKCGYAVCICYRPAAVERITPNLKSQ